MKKVRVKISFRYDAEVVTEAEEEVLTEDGQEALKQETLENLNFDFDADGDNGVGAISDWKLDIEEIE